MTGEGGGNVLLRRIQYRAADDPLQCCEISRTMIFGKLYNARWSMERTRRDHGLRLNGEKLARASQTIRDLLPAVSAETDLERLRGLEGVGAAAYFDVLDDMILNTLGGMIGCLCFKILFFWHKMELKGALDEEKTTG